jgi:hypothetical protein
MKYANLRLHALLGFSAGFFGAMLEEQDNEESD